MTKDVPKTAGLDEILDVAPVSWAFRNEDLGSAFRFAQLDGGRDYVRVGVDHLIAMIFHQVGLENHSLVGQGHNPAVGAYCSRKMASRSPL